LFLIKKKDRLVYTLQLSTGEVGEYLNGEKFFWTGKIDDKGNVKDGVGSFNSKHKREIMPVREGDGSGGSAVVGREINLKF
jgi:hypothetical protein